MQTPLQSGISAVSSFEAVFNRSFDDRPIRRASWAAIIVGLVGVLGLSWLFVAAAPLMALAGSQRLGWFTLVPTLTLLLSVGGYGMLAFYGLRLRYLWKRRFLPPVPGARHNLRSLALTDLKKIRWYSGAVLLTVLTSYLLPEDSPVLIGESDSWDLGNRSTPSATQQIAVVWIIMTVLPVLFARWAAWEIAAAAGDLAGPDDSRAFQVIAPSASTLDVASPASTAGPLLAAVPLTAEDIRGIGRKEEPCPALPVAAKQEVFDRFAAADRLATRRDWELVLLMLLVLLLLVSVGFADGHRPLRDVLGNPTIWFTRYQQVQAMKTPAGTTSHPMAGVLTLLCPFLLWVLSIASILWTALCLMSGPRWRGIAILLMGCAVVLIATNAVAMSLVAPYWEILTSMVQQPFVRIERTPWTSLNLAIVPLTLLVILTRPSMRMLFDQHVRKRRTG